MSTLEKETVALPPLGQEGERCPACGAALATDQRYCLNCGMRRAETRVPFRDVVVRKAQREEGSTPGPVPPAAHRDWTPVVTLGALGMLAIVLVLGILIGRTGAEDGGGGTPQVVTVGGGGTAATSGGATHASAGKVAETWPEGKSGWTVELGSISKDASPEQVGAARKSAEAKGAADVGLIDSDAHESLPGGSWIVYSGVYDDRAGASKALKGLRQDFPDAQVIEVSDAKPRGESVDLGDAETLDTQELDELDDLSGDEYVKKSRKLADETAIPGEAPPTDDKAPGAGSDAEVIE